MNNQKKRPRGAYRHAAPIQIPDVWAEAMTEAGFVNPYTGEPSIQALYKASGVHASAISRIIGGRTKEPRGETIMKLAEALGVSFTEVATWVNTPYTNYIPWEPPEAANLMTPQNRQLVENLIQQLVKSQTDEDYIEWNKSDGKTTP